MDRPSFRWIRFYLVMVRKRMRAVLSQRFTPHSIALGAAIGTFIGMLPTPGMNMLLTFIFTSLLKVSRVSGLIAVWVSNPVTFVPITYFEFWLGSLIVPSTQISYDTFSRSVLKAETDGGEWYQLLNQLVSFLKYLVEKLPDIFVALVVGSVIFAGVCALIAYPVTLRTVLWFRRVRAERREKRILLMKEGEEHG